MRMGTSVSVLVRDTKMPPYLASNDRRRPDAA